MAAKKMADIAKEANVSITTVSRVINNNGYVSKEKREKILKIIENNNYRIDSIARSLRKMQTNTIGLVMTQIYPDPFQAEIALFLEKEAKNNNYLLLIGNSLGNAKEEKEIIEVFINYRVDGVIFSYLISKESIESLKKNNIPCVLIERRRNLKNINIILMDYYKGIKIAVEHLLDKGAKRIGFIGARLCDEVEAKIFEGYKETIIQNNIEFDESIVFFGWMNVETGYNGVMYFYNNNNIPDSCIIVNDITTMGALRALRQCGLNVPEDMMIVSTDNTLSRFLTPSISSVSYGKKNIATAGFDLILKSLNNTKFKPKVIVLEPRLMARESSKSY
jgi:DNA-binding LacI/PurR family transcriptional regulator